MTKGKPNETQRYVFLVSVDKALENRYCSSNWSLLQYTARSYNSITIQHDICVTKEEQTTLKNCKSPNCDVIQWLLHIFPLWVLLLNRKLVNFFASGTVSVIMHQLWTIKLEEQVFFFIQLLILACTFILKSCWKRKLKNTTSGPNSPHGQDIKQKEDTSTFVINVSNAPPQSRDFDLWTSKYLSDWSLQANPHIKKRKVGILLARHLVGMLWWAQNNFLFQKKLEGKKNQTNTCTFIAKSLTKNK